MIYVGTERNERKWKEMKWKINERNEMKAIKKWKKFKWKKNNCTIKDNEKREK